MKFDAIAKSEEHMHQAHNAQQSKATDGEAFFMLRDTVLQVDCSSLPEGLHYAEISATDSTAPWRGHVFRIPVTVIKPASTGEDSSSRDITDASGDYVFPSHQGEPALVHTGCLPPHLSSY